MRMGMGGKGEAEKTLLGLCPTSTVFGGSGGIYEQSKEDAINSDKIRLRVGEVHIPALHEGF